MLLRDPLTRAVSTRFLSYLLNRQLIDPEFRRYIHKHGGCYALAQSDARQLVSLLYGATFEASAAPFITSFCSHAGDASYVKEHGLLSQWRGYGSDGFCIVFETASLVTLLCHEFETYNWVHFTIGHVCYATEDVAINSEFPVLLDRCASLLYEKKRGLAQLFIASAPRFKHQGFREEREVRIVAVPAPREVLAHLFREHPDYDLPKRTKTIYMNEASEHRRHIALFETMGTSLPIKRVIVGPSPNQKDNYARARAVIAPEIPITCSATPFASPNPRCPP